MRKVNVITNHFELKARDLKRLYLYHLEVKPRLERDNRKTKELIIDSLKDKIISHIGIFVLTGYNIYAS